MEVWYPIAVYERSSARVVMLRNDDRARLGSWRRPQILPDDPEDRGEEAWRSSEEWTYEWRLDFEPVEFALAADNDVHAL
jgi:hypothetical protein